jgi:hypothetical protein
MNVDKMRHQVERTGPATGMGLTSEFDMADMLTVGMRTSLWPDGSLASKLSGVDAQDVVRAAERLTGPST